MSSEEAIRKPSNDTLGQAIPPDTPHAVSVSLPTWRSNVGYEEGEKWVVDKMQTGYPRFFIHKTIQRLASTIVNRYGAPNHEMAMLFPSQRCARRCESFLIQNSAIQPSDIRVLDFVPHTEKVETGPSKFVQPRLSCVLFPKALWPTAKAFWQHTGEGVSSRRAEFCLKALEENAMVESSTLADSNPRLAKGPKRYQRLSVGDTVKNTETDLSSSISAVEVPDGAQFVEERFGRNLDVTLASQARRAIKRRIAGTLINDGELPESLSREDDTASQRSRDVPGFSADDVYLHPCGMNAMFHAHLALRFAVRDEVSMMYGFPYVDTLKVLEKFGPGAVFFGHGNSIDLDAIEAQLEAGDRFLALFCEFPGNPLLQTPNLKRIRELSDQYDFAVVIDETLANFLNVHVLPYADVVISSLTKIFSGDSNVMGGSMILNPRSKYYSRLKPYLDQHYEDNLFEEDSLYLERNSRDFVSRIQRINHNAELVADVLRAHPAVKQVNYPKYSVSKHYYDACRLPGGGYGGLLSATFSSQRRAEVFYDHLDTQKGPSLGTNFTLSSPFVLLAHYGELDWAAKYGCDVTLVRFSVGLEDPEELKTVFKRALDAAAKV